MADSDDIEKGPELPQAPPSLKKLGSYRLSDSGRPQLVRQLSDSLRNVASIVGPKQPLTFYCGICLENVAVESAFTLHNCNHKFCQECLTSFLTNKINESQIFPKCFGTSEEDFSKSEACGADIDPSDLQKLVTEDTLKKYQRFLFNKTHENSRQCPKCDANLVGDPKNPSMSCFSCHYEFCYFHNDAHLGSSCVEYDKKQALDDKLSKTLLSTTTKPCPGCRMPVEKIGGCNHMICPRCQASFCWICVRLVDKGELPTHFAWWNLLGCPNMQMTEDEGILRKCRLCFYLVALIQTLVLGPVVLAIVIASTICCCCCLGVAYKEAIKEDPNKSGTDLAADYCHASFEIWSLVIIFSILGAIVLGVGCAFCPIIACGYGIYLLITRKKNDDGVPNLAKFDANLSMPFNDADGAEEGIVTQQQEEKLFAPIDVDEDHATLQQDNDAVNQGPLQ